MLGAGVLIWVKDVWAAEYFSTAPDPKPRPNRGVGAKRPPRGGGSGAAKSKILHLGLKFKGLLKAK